MKRAIKHTHDLKGFFMDAMPIGKSLRSPMWKMQKSNQTHIEVQHLYMHRFIDKTTGVTKVGDIEQINTRRKDASMRSNTLIGPITPCLFLDRCIEPKQLNRQKEAPYGNFKAIGVQQIECGLDGLLKTQRYIREQNVHHGRIHGRHPLDCIETENHI